MFVLYIVLSLVLGLVVGWFFAKKWSFPVKDLSQELALSREENARLKGQIDGSSNELAKLLLELKCKNEDILKLVAQNSSLLESKKNSEEKLRDLNEIKDKLTHEFENLAHKIFDAKMSSFQKESTQRIDLVLSPFKEKLSEFQGAVSKYREDGIKETSSLKTEIANILKLNHKLSTDAENLTKALKGDNKTQGNWGELILEKVLEGSGLREGQEFTLQGKELGLKNADGSIQKPDVIINLPDQKHIIIDSKVSLVAYERYISSDDQAIKAIALKDFLISLKHHIRGLSEKQYHNLNKLLTPDFVLLFVPIEGAFSFVLQNDTELFQYGWDKKIILVSPTTLMVTLRTIESIWKQEKQNKYTLEIVKQAGEIYDKFVGFVDDFECVRTSVKKTSENIESAFNKLRTGKGNLIGRFENLKKMGVKANKELTTDYDED